MITIIIPVHSFNDNVATYLLNAIKSVDRQVDVKDLIVSIVFPTKIKEQLSDFVVKNTSEYKNISPGNILLTENLGNFDFQSQVNFGVSESKTDYFSILEFDDEYSEIYFRNIEKYIQAYPDVDLFLPITILVTTNGTKSSLINDIAWSRDFVGDDSEQGFISLQGLKKYTTFSITGGVYKVSSFNAVGKLKKNIKLTFNYEFMLRLLNSGRKIMTIGKVGYKHVMDREDSLFVGYNAVLTMKERKFWFDIANKEYYFNEDRKIDLSRISQETNNA